MITLHDLIDHITLTMSGILTPRAAWPLVADRNSDGTLADDGLPIQDGLELSDNGKAVVAWRFYGTDTNGFDGHPPSERDVRVRGVTIAYGDTTDDLVSYVDWLSLYAQLDVHAGGRTVSSPARPEPLENRSTQG